MFIPFLAAASVATAFAQLGARSANIAVLTSLVPADSTTCRQLLPLEGTIAGYGLASGASITSGVL